MPPLFEVGVNYTSNSLVTSRLRAGAKSNQSGASIYGSISFVTGVAFGADV